jgi:chaperonin GroEL (HSP60 family)
VLASDMQDNECGDATNLVVVLGGELLNQVFFLFVCFFFLTLR